MLKNKNNIILLVILVVGASITGTYLWKLSVNPTSQISAIVDTSLVSPSPEASFFPTPTSKPSLTRAPVPLPSGDGRTTFIGETVPWSLLLADASCELKGEIKFLNRNTYDNQDAMFIYKGIDHPARNVFWTVTPQDDISVGPNIFNKIPIPDGESLLGVFLPDNPKFKRYEITAKIQYGRQVGVNGNFVTAGGNVKVFEKQCDGKTIVVLP